MNYNKIKGFDKINLRHLREDLDELFAKYEKRTGVKMDTGKIRYSEGSATIQVEATLPKSDVLTSEQKAVGIYSDFKFGDQVRVNQLGIVKIVGYKTRNRKYPFIVEPTGGKGGRYKLSENQVLKSNQVR